MTVRLVGTLALPDARRAAIIDALPDHIRLTRAEPGCLRFKVDTQQAHLFVDELFVDEDALHAHQCRIRGTHWEAVTAGLKRDYTLTRG